MVHVISLLTDAIADHVRSFNVRSSPGGSSLVGNRVEIVGDGGYGIEQ